MRAPNRPLVKAAALASAITIVSQIAAAALRGVYPFGTNNHNLNDLWAQLIPFHAHLRRLLTGQGISDWQFNWNSGLGVGWLADYATYVSSPFALLAAVFPADTKSIAMGIEYKTSRNSSRISCST